MKGRHRMEVGCKGRWKSGGQEGRRQEGKGGKEKIHEGM